MSHLMELDETNGMEGWFVKASRLATVKTVLFTVGFGLIDRFYKNSGSSPFQDQILIFHNHFDLSYPLWLG